MALTTSNAIDNANLVNICQNYCNVAGFNPNVTYTYNAATNQVVVTDSSVLIAGDSVKACHLKIMDKFGGEIRAELVAPGQGGAGTASLTGAGVGSIAVAAPGSGYGTTPPLVQLVGGGGTGATATAVLTGGVITGFTVTAPGTGYTSAPQVVLVNPESAKTIDVSSLNNSKFLDMYVTITTLQRLSADGNALNLQAAGSVSPYTWDIKQNA